MSGISDEKLIEKIKKRIITEEDIKRSNWRYIGDSEYGIQYIHANFRVPERIRITHKDKCICGINIIQQCYIFNTKTNQILVLGNECIKRWKKNRCDMCDTIHRNRKDNFCNDCRKKISEEEKKKKQKEKEIKECLSYTLTFGKYKGNTIEEIYSIDKKYLEWIKTNLNSESNQSLIHAINIIQNIPEEEMDKRLRDKTKKDRSECFACGGSGTSYWSDECYGPCLECCCINCKKFDDECKC